MYCLDMLAMAIELAQHDPTYEDVCTKFFEHFLTIGSAVTERDGYSLWDERRRVLLRRARVRTAPASRWRGAVRVSDSSRSSRSRPSTGRCSSSCRSSAVARRVVRPQAPRPVSQLPRRGLRRSTGTSLLVAGDSDRLRRILFRMLDEAEFLSPYGLRSVSKGARRANPVRLDLDGVVTRGALPARRLRHELFGGNSNWGAGRSGSRSTT